jgi:hypothetical protein
MSDVHDIADHLEIEALRSEFSRGLPLRKWPAV